MSMQNITTTIIIIITTTTTTFITMLSQTCSSLSITFYTPDVSLMTYHWVDFSRWLVFYNSVTEFDSVYCTNMLYTFFLKVCFKFRQNIVIFFWSTNIYFVLSLKNSPLLLWFMICLVLRVSDGHCHALRRVLLMRCTFAVWFASGHWKAL